MKLDKFLQEKYDYNPDVRDGIQTYIDQWKSWYKGNVKDFHNYFVYNGNKKVKQKRFTMNMAKEISEDWSDLLWSEKCEISLGDDSSQEQFDELSDDLDLWFIINQALEKSGALGTSSTVVSVYDIIENEDGMYLDVSEAKTRIDLVDIDWIFPLSWTNKGITECAFGSVEYRDGQKYVVLSVHKIADDGNYHIYNHLFKDNNLNLTEIENNGSTMADFNTQSDIKWFSVFEPPLTNNIFENSPFGIPHFANAIDNMKAVDISFDALKNEVLDGRKRIFARADMFSYDDGQQKLVFDPNDTTIYQLPKGATKDDLIQSESDTLRTNQQIETLNTNLNILGNKVGFGENHYHFDGTNLSTATAVVSSNSKMFRRKKKLEIGYESSIYDLVKAICYASSTFGQYNINFEEIAIQFDDSIVEDKEAESNRALREVNAGLISKIEYREKIFGETEENAKQSILNIEAEMLSIEEMMGQTAVQQEEDRKQNNDRIVNNALKKMGL